ncbi:MAG: hypothetical protein QGE94_06020 [Desulfobacterales bacterium]|nr:hypothetical protein [Desulfobacterales bacterium]
MTDKRQQIKSVGLARVGTPYYTPGRPFLGSARRLLAGYAV